MNTWGDEDGLLWTTPVKVGRSASSGGQRAEAFRQAPPPSDYKLPDFFPRLRDGKRVTIDTETHDPDLKSKGPGARRDGFIVGVAVKVDDAPATYYPVRHDGGPNLEARNVFGWLSEELRDYRGELLNAHLLYDMDYLANEDVFAWNAKWRDIQIAQPLLDEEQDAYSLEALAQQHLGYGKLEEEIEQLYGKDWKRNMRRIHPGHAATYANGDVDPIALIYDKQIPLLQREGVWTLWDEVECELLKVLLYMRRRGVRVDLDAADRLNERLQGRAQELVGEIHRLTGRTVTEQCATGEAAAVLRSLGLEVPKTEHGADSIVSPWLDAHPHPVCALMKQLRGIEKIRGTFVEGYFKHAINGRLHCQFHSMKGDEYGARTGRLSSSHPNLQNIPVRDDELGPIVRGLFLPDEGKLWWAKDYSQIEYRFLVHFALLGKCPGAEVAAEMYRTDPSTDFHRIAEALTGKPRKVAKNINFGVVYGMGVDTMAVNLGVPSLEAKEILEEFHGKMPFMRAAYRMAASRASERGEVRTIMGRKRRFNLWEPSKWGAKKKSDPALPREEAIAKWTNVRRAYTHKALNAALQGSAADLTKKAMVDGWNAGLYGPGDTPLELSLTVHDELDGDCDDSSRSRAALAELNALMENALKLRIPVLVAGDMGENWSAAK